MTFAESVRRYRTEAGLSQESLGEMIGISGQAVSKWETTNSLPDPALLPALADALNVSLDALFDRRSDDPADLYRTIAGWIGSYPEEERMEQLFRVTDAAFRAALGGVPAPLLPDPEADEDKTEGRLAHYSWQINRQDANGVLYDTADFPFVSLALEPAKGWASVMEDERIPGWFACLADPDVYRCVLYLCRHEPSHTELPILMRKSGIDPARAEEVGGLLKKLGFVSVETVSVNGRDRRIATLWNMNMRNMIVTLIVSVRAAFLRNRGHHGCSRERTHPLFEKAE